MDARDIAFTALGRVESASAADGQHLARKAARIQLAEQKIQPGAMTTDDHKIGRPNGRTDKVHVDWTASFQILTLTWNDHKAIGPAERGYGARAFAHRESDQIRGIRPLHQAN